MKYSSAVRSRFAQTGVGDSESYNCLEHMLRFNLAIMENLSEGQILERHKK